MKTNFNIENINQNFIISKYLTIADSLFANIAKRFTDSQHRKIYFEAKLPTDLFNELASRVENYIKSSLTHDSIEWAEQNIYEVVAQNYKKISNLTSNGVLYPRKELNKEVNSFHDIASKILYHFNCESEFEYAQYPVFVRLSIKDKFKKNQKLDNAVVSADNNHCDTWFGEPIDFINFSIPMYIGGAGMNFEIHEPSKDTEVYALCYYEDLHERTAEKYINKKSTFQVQAGIGSIFAFDARAMHRTLIEPLTSIRCSFEFRLRYKYSKNQKDIEKMINTLPGSKNMTYMSFNDYLRLGKDQFLDFNESFGEDIDTSPDKYHRFSRRGRPNIVKYNK